MDATCPCHRLWHDASDYYDHLRAEHRASRDAAFLLGCLAAANIAWDYLLDAEGNLVLLAHQPPLLP